MPLECPSCASEHLPEARFCSECGAPLYRACPRCGAESPAGAAFCAACGMALREGDQQPQIADEQQERRVVSVLFADLAGSTALASKLDPEDVRELQSELFALIGTEVERFGGITEKFVGDAVLAVFGVPQIHEDDAERAVRAALAVHERFERFGAAVARKHGADLGLRVAVNTGEVVSSREAAARGDLVVSGDSVNVAARLQQHAEPGETLVGERTHAATSRAIAYGSAREIAAKGISQPVRAWPVARLMVEAEAGGVAGFVAPLIGRDPELELLSAVAARAEREATPQLVTLYGPAGVGKSRLLAELLARVGPASLLTGRCLPYSHGSLYWPLAEGLKREAGILDTDSREVALASLRAAVDPLVHSGQADRVREALAWTVGLTLPDSAMSVSDPQEVVRRLQDAWKLYLGALGRDGLAVVVLEDVHWASGELLDLVDHLAERLIETRLMILCTARPELLETRFTWGAGKPNATALTIAPLSPDDAGRLTRSLLGDADVPEGLSERVLATAEGNPFFVEEMLRMLIEEGALERRDEEWFATELLPDVAIPDSVHGVVAARIDLLDPIARDALRRCAVIGRAFWPSAVGVDAVAVRSLERRGLVFEHPDSVMAGMSEFVFKHSVTRDVAYSTLPRAERGSLHRRTAEWIEAVAPDRALELAELTAFHYCEAIACGVDEEVVVRRAFRLCMTASEGAFQRGAFEAAETHLRRAVDLTADDGERAAVMLGLGRVDVMGASFERALAELDEAERLAPPHMPELRSDILGWRSRACWLQGLWAEALSSANGAVEALMGLPESPQLARALARRSQIEMLKSRPEALAHAREAIAVAHRVEEPAAEVNARVNLFTVEAMRGTAPNPGDLATIVARALEAGTSDEAYRAVVNFIWSAAGYHPVSLIEQTAAEARSRIGGVAPPYNLGEYLDFSLATMLYIPAGRWLDADEILAEHAEPPAVDATNRLVWLGLVAGLALRRGDVVTAGQLIEELHPAAMASGEPQRIIPMAAVALPWAAVSGEHDLLRSWAGEILDALAASAVLSSLPAVRALAASGETDLLARLAESLRRAGLRGSSNLSTSLEAAEGLVALAHGRTGDAVGQLEAAADRQRALENTYHAACLDLDLVRAYEAAGAATQAADARARAALVLEPLGCVNVY